MREDKLVIAIDGPAASGKSTTARLVASRLGYLYVDTGAMYRAVTLGALKRGIDLRSQADVETVAPSLEIELLQRDDGLRIILNGDDVTGEIRAPEVTKTVSTISRYRGVRETLVRKQREIGRNGGIVLEGRDIGTVVFPDADLKIFLIADLAARSERRGRELQEQGVEISTESLQDEISRRDRIDSTRTESPLSKAEDAVELDTSSLTIEEQVEFVVKKAEEIRRARKS